MKYLIVSIICLFLISCSLLPKYEVSKCRHRALECALVYGDKVGNEGVGIAVGPTKTPALWHAQAHLKPSMHWIRYNGNLCELGEQENFSPQIFMTTAEFMRFTFGWVK